MIIDFQQSKTAIECGFALKEYRAITPKDLMAMKPGTPEFSALSIDQKIEFVRTLRLRQEGVL